MMVCWETKFLPCLSLHAFLHSKPLGLIGLQPMLAKILAADDGTAPPPDGSRPSELLLF